MNKESRLLATALLALIWATGLQGCATTGAPDGQGRAEPSAPSTADAATVTRDMVTVENLLRWPLEGPKGADRLTAALDQLFIMKPLRASQFSGDGPVRLADGYVLGFAFVRKLSGNIDIGLKSEPCLSPARAAVITGAIQEPGVQDAHGADIGQSFKATRNGMTVRMDTTPVTYECITTLHIHPEQEARQ